LAQQGVAPEKPAFVSLRCTTAVFPVNLSVIRRKNPMRLAAILVSSLALLLALAWLISSPAYDSAVACVAALAALLSSFFLKREQKSESQNQNVSGSSVGIQAGRDANVRDIRKD
jgi:FtsH-binding integral membrane protein